MGRILVLAIIVITVLFSQAISSQPLNYKPGLIIQSDRVHNLNTGLNYTTIQEAINANETLNGHTISVDAGIYNENVVVNKSLTLTGENRSTTVIDGKGTRTVITVVSDSVIVSAFTIRNSGTDFGDNGIVLSGVSDCVIDGNNVTANRIGIYLVSSDNNTIRHNTITENGYGVYGLLCNTTIVEGNVLENEEKGIFLADSSGNTLRNNNMTGNRDNLGIVGESLAHFLNDIDITNTVYGKAVYYLVNNNDLVLNSSLFPNAGFIALINSTRIRVEGLNLARNFQGILLAYTDNSTIKDMNITKNWIGIYLFASTHNMLIENRATENSLGINLSGACNNTLTGNWVTKNHDGIHVGSDTNRLIRNRISDNEYRGVYVVGSGNLFRENEISNNGKGIVTDFTNIIYHNNFVNNTEHANLNLPRATGIWDNGAEGNYWSNHNTTDLNHDGIGGTPYEIAVNNTDRYPLMGMFSDFNATSEHHVQTICNSTISDFQFNGTTISFDVTGENDTAGFCRICIPKTLMNDTFTVFVNRTQVDYDLLPCSNNTHNYLYFTYNHSTREIIIIPEFPSFLILPLFMLVTLLAVIVYRKRPKMSKE